VIGSFKLRPGDGVWSEARDAGWQGDVAADTAISRPTSASSFAVATAPSHDQNSRIRMRASTRHQSVSSFLP
jgi:hypothetical protein